MRTWQFFVFFFIYFFFHNLFYNSTAQAYSLYSTNPSNIEVIKSIECEKYSQWLLQIEVDKYESLPLLSEIHFYKRNVLIVNEKAPKVTISLETDPPQFAYKFILPANSRITFLQVNITNQTASMIYKAPKMKPKLIKFENCFFNQTPSFK